MSYVTLHASYPMSGLGDAYSDCVARNAQSTEAYQLSLAEWKKAQAAYQRYQEQLTAWNKQSEERKRAEANQQSWYRSAQREYQLKKEAWEKARAIYVRDMTYNQNVSAKQAAARRAVEQKYNIKLPADCISSGQKTEMQRVCSSVKGIGYVFSMGEFPACALAELPTCQPRRVVVDPGPMPEPPQKPTPLPPLGTKPSPVPKPGPAPPTPKLESCTRPEAPPADDRMAAGAVRTFGLIAILAVGGGVLGYRAWRKRKRN